MTTVWQMLVDALTLGSLYALFAIGVALVFGIMRLINFAHGDLIMIGGYAAVLTAAPIWWVVIAATGCVVVAALVMERLAFRPVRDANLTTMLVTSFAVSFACQSVATALFGSLQRGASVAPGLNHAWSVGSLRIPVMDPVLLGTTAALCAALTVFLNGTSMGMQMRAAAEDFPTARMLGVRSNRVIAIAFAISGLFASVGAFFYTAQLGYVTPNVGTSPVLAAFVAVVVGGIGSLRGALIGGYLLGLVTVVLQTTLPSDQRGFTTALCYLIVLGLLVIRPQGLMPSSAGLAERV